MNLRPLQQDRNIDPEKASNFRASFPKNLWDFYDELIANTRYVDFNTFQHRLIAVANAIKEPNFNVFVDLDVDVFDHSEYWCLGLVWPHISHKVSKVFTSSDDITDELPLVLFDDIICTCVQMCSKMMEIAKYAKIKSKLRVILAIPYATDSLRALLPLTMDGRRNPDLKVDKNKIGCEFEDILVAELIKPVCFFKSYSMDSYLDNPEGNPYSFPCTALPVYFDHGMPNSHGSFPQIYKSIMKNRPSRLGMEIFAAILSNWYSAYKNNLTLKEHLDLALIP